MEYAKTKTNFKITNYGIKGWNMTSKDSVQQKSSVFWKTKNQTLVKGIILKIFLKKISTFVGLFQRVRICNFLWVLSDII